MNYIFNLLFRTGYSAVAVELNRQQLTFQKNEKLISFTAQRQLKEHFLSLNPDVKLATEMQAHIFSFLCAEDLKNCPFLLSNSLSKLFIPAKSWLTLPHQEVSDAIELFKKWEPRKLDLTQTQFDSAQVIALLENIDTHQIEQLNLSKTSLTIQELEAIASLVPNISHIYTKEPEVIQDAQPMLLPFELIEGELEVLQGPLSPALIKGVIAVLRAHPLGLQYLRDEIKNDREFILQAIQALIWIASHTPPQLLEDAKFMLQVIEINCCDLLYYASPKLLEDPEFMLQAIKINTTTLLYADLQLKKDPEFMLRAVKITPLSLFHATSELKKDPEFILEAIKTNLHSLSYATADLKRDPEFMLKAIKVNPSCFNYIEKDLKKDLTFMEQAAQIRRDKLKERNLLVAMANLEIKDQSHILSFLPSQDLKTYRPFFDRKLNQTSKGVLLSKSCFTLPKQDIHSSIATINEWGVPQDLCLTQVDLDAGKAIQLLKAIAADKIKKLDLSNVILTIKDLEEMAPLLPKISHLHVKNPSSILIANRASTSFFRAKKREPLNQALIQAILAVLRAQPSAWEHLSEEIRSDSKLMLKAMLLKEGAISYVSIKLLNDPEFMLQAIELDPFAIRKISDKLSDDPIFMREAMKKNKNSFLRIGNNLEKDKEFMAEARLLYNAS